MKTKFAFIDPGLIMAAVVAIIILAVGTFAFFVTVQQLTSQVPVGTDESASAVWNNRTRLALANGTTTGNNVFNIVGVVLIIGAIMSIVGFVYQYVR